MKILFITLLTLASGHLYALDLNSYSSYVDANGIPEASKQKLIDLIQKNKAEIQTMKYCEVRRNTTIVTSKSGKEHSYTSIECESFHLSVKLENYVHTTHEMVRRDMIAEMLKLGFKFEGCIESTQLTVEDEKYHPIKMMICSLVNSK